MSTNLTSAKFGTMPAQTPQWTEFLSCQVCYNIFNETAHRPVSLACGHTVCRTCLLKLPHKKCPFDQNGITRDVNELPVNYALLQLVGAAIPAVDQLSTQTESSDDDEDVYLYNTAKRCIEELALYLKPVSSANGMSTNCNSTSAAPGLTYSSGNNNTILSRPMQRKLVTLVNSQLVEEEGRARAARAARSLGERTVTELILQHQNPQQLSANLWAAVRARGCQFLGPAMQEEVLKLILLALEDGSLLSRKVLVLFVVQRLEAQYPQASKTAIGHVVQLLYRASCFKVTKRDEESSLMQLKEEFRVYDALRREHDSQIVQIAMESGLRIAPDQWSSLLYGDTSHKSHMQSIIDKLQTPQSFSQSVNELVIALQRTGDPFNLQRLQPHLEFLANIDPNPDAPTPSWRNLEAVMKAVKTVVQGLVDFVQNNGQKKLEIQSMPNLRYKTSMCRDLSQKGHCPRGASCTFAHSQEELEKYRARNKKTAKSPFFLSSSSSLTAKEKVELDHITKTTHDKLKAASLVTQSRPGIDSTAGDPGTTQMTPSSNSIISSLASSISSITIHDKVASPLAPCSSSPGTVEKCRSSPQVQAPKQSQQAQFSSDDVRRHGMRMSKIPGMTMPLGPGITMIRNVSGATNQGPQVVVSQGQGMTVNQGPTMAINQGPSLSVNPSPQMTVNQAPRMSVNQGPGMAVNQSQRVPVNQGPGVPVNQGAGVPVNQGAGVPVNQGAGMAGNQGPGMPINQGQGVPVNQGPGMPMNVQNPGLMMSMQRMVFHNMNPYAVNEAGNCYQHNNVGGFRPSSFPVMQQPQFNGIQYQPQMDNVIGQYMPMCQLPSNLNPYAEPWCQAPGNQYYVPTDSPYMSGAHFSDNYGMQGGQGQGQGQGQTKVLHDLQNRRDEILTRLQHNTGTSTSSLQESTDGVASINRYKPSSSLSSFGLCSTPEDHQMTSQEKSSQTWLSSLVKSVNDMVATNRTTSTLANMEKSSGWDSDYTTWSSGQNSSSHWTTTSMSSSTIASSGDLVVDGNEVWNESSSDSTEFMLNWLKDIPDDPVPVENKSEIQSHISEDGQRYKRKNHQRNKNIKRHGHSSNSGRCHSVMSDKTDDDNIIPFDPPIVSKYGPISRSARSKLKITDPVQVTADEASKQMTQVTAITPTSRPHPTAMHQPSMAQPMSNAWTVWGRTRTSESVTDSYTLPEGISRRNLQDCFKRELARLEKQARNAYSEDEMLACELQAVELQISLQTATNSTERCPIPVSARPSRPWDTEPNIDRPMGAWGSFERLASATNKGMNIDDIHVALEAQKKATETLNHKRRQEKEDRLLAEKLVLEELKANKGSV